MKIGIIVGSTRPGRLGAAVGEWVHALATQRQGETAYELVDLASFDLPLLSEPTVPGMAGRRYEVEQTRAWSAKIDELDAFVFVTPEYNHSVPAAMKNAVDVLGPEWAGKAVGFVSYGADGGVRAVEHWRTIVANLFMHAVRGQVALQLFGGEVTDGQVTPNERRAGELGTVLDQVEELAGALARTQS